MYVVRSLTGVPCRGFSLSAVVLLIGTSLTHDAFGITPTPQETSTCREWVSTAFRAAGPFPFSFIYGGRHSAELLPTWQKQTSSQEMDSGKKRHELVFTDPASGLRVTCIVTEYSDFPAVEWVVLFKNTGQADTPILSNVLPLNTEITNSASGAPFGLRYALGSHERSDDFRPFETRTFGSAETMTFTSFGGRSSDGYLPFFNLIKSTGGVMLGIGWTGQWTASFRHTANGSMAVTAGMEFTHFKLLPGEEVRTPAILLEFWEGDEPLRGHNLLRALLRDHYTPRPGGKPLKVPLALSAHGTVSFEESTEENMLNGIQRAAELKTPFDTWWIDTGWFELIKKNWARSVGNIAPDPVRYPNGMRPVADAAHRNGMKFLLWFEPERVMRDTWLYNKHRSWLLAPPSNLPFELSYMYYDGFHLLDLGNDLARVWLTTYVSESIDEMGIDVYRQDFNMFPVYYWRDKEGKDRQGIREIKYVMGLYQFWDDLLKTHPNLLIDNCASGGRRIDFETLRRSVVLTRSDVIFRSPTSSQCIGFGLSHWIPFHGMGSVTVEPYQFRSGLGAIFVVAANLNEGDDLWAQMNRLVTQYNEYRHLYEGDFYPLTPYELGDDQTLGWQYDRPDLGEGLIQVFRREKCPADEVQIKVRGLEENAEYELVDIDQPDSPRRFKGQQLMNQGLSVALPAKPSAVLYRYHKSEERGQASPTQ
jgi:alpha-galactosidase